jgi:hypothetical protein
MIVIPGGERKRQVVKDKLSVESGIVKDKGARENQRNQAKRDLDTHCTSRVRGALNRSDALLTRTYHVNECVGDSHRLAESDSIFPLGRFKV